MAATILQTIPLAGRTYKVDANGAADVVERYKLTLSEPLAIDALPTTFTGVPQIGTTHPNRAGFYCKEYEVEQPEGAEKATLSITAKYGPADITTVHLETGDEIESVTEWGWDDGTSEKELVYTVEQNPKPVVNSAGDPWESAPTVSVPTPTFTKVVRTNKRKDYTPYLCAVNTASVTIGAMVCAPCTLLCSVAEKKLIGESKMPYEYTIHLKYRSNKCDVGGTETECGWDVAVVDTGYYQLNTDNPPKKVLIQNPSSETNESASLSAPFPLDGHGHAKSDTQTDPFIIRFPSYNRVTFPTWFYSEPPTPGVSTPNAQNSGSGGSGTSGGTSSGGSSGGDSSGSNSGS